MKGRGHLSVAIKQESLFSIKWDLTTVVLLMNQFHSSKKFLIADIVAFFVTVHWLRKIPDISFYRGEIDHVLSGKKPADDPVLRKKWTLMNGICMNLGTAT